MVSTLHYIFKEGYDLFKNVDTTLTKTDQTSSAYWEDTNTCRFPANVASNSVSVASRANVSWGADVPAKIWGW